MMFYKIMRLRFVYAEPHFGLKQKLGDSLHMDNSEFWSVLYRYHNNMLKNNYKFINL